jgi:hypothetical protein
MTQVVKKHADLIKQYAPLEFMELQVSSLGHKHMFSGLHITMHANLPCMAMQDVQAIMSVYISALYDEADANSSEATQAAVNIHEKLRKMFKNERTNVRHKISAEGALKLPACLSLQYALPCVLMHYRVA